MRDQQLLIQRVCDQIELTKFCDGKQKCEHENEIMRQGDGTVYGYCGDCGKELY